MIEAAIFDIDGTLIDSVDAHAEAWVEGFKRHGFAVDYEPVRRQIGKGSDQLLPVFLGPDDLDAFGPVVDATQGEVFKQHYLATIQPFPGVRELFERLKRDGVTRVLASSGKAKDVSINQRIAGVEGLVDAVATSEDVDRSKPAPDIVHAALKRIAPTPGGRCVFIGDTPYDAEAAIRASVPTVGVLGGGFAEDELRSAGCRAVYRDVKDLLDHYEDWAGRTD